jgi:cyclase
MLKTRIIPTLLLRNASLVKTKQFGKFTYVGDPANTVRIFNELEVDELIFLDIMASIERRSPNLKVLSEIADECFMPLAYGGGLKCLDDVKAIFDIGFEKVSINSEAIRNPKFISEIAQYYGSQAIIASIDVKKSFFGQNTVRYFGTRRKATYTPVAWAQELERLGAGEILLTAVDREGTWEGFDLELTKEVADAVSIPVIAHGGAGSSLHICEAVQQANASAVALGSMVVFQKKGMGVLVNFPDKALIENALSKMAN